MNYKLQQIMAAKKTPKTEADKAGMSNLLARLREKRELAVKTQPEVRDDEGHRTVQE